jgi:gas vesicle protein
MNARRAPGFFMRSSSSPQQPSNGDCAEQTSTRQSHLYLCERSLAKLCRTVAKDIRFEVIVLKGDAMKGFLVGLGIGIGLGVLFAPMSGEETRNNLSQRANDLADSAREAYETNKDRIQRGVEQIRTGTERVMSQARNTAGDVASDVSQRASNL